VGAADHRRVRRLLLIACLVALAVTAVPAAANTSHAGWPRITGVLLMNKDDGSRPLDARPGMDPFDGQDDRYSCDSVHLRGACQEQFVDGDDGALVMPSATVHNELLGGHGSDTIHAGPYGDVLWGDYKPSGQPTAQHDRLFGGAGRDFIYASHGYNLIAAGPGDDWIKAHYGHGIIDCGGGDDVVYVSRRAQKHYVIRNCETISHKTLGY
jgi:Ca2+-binding RTX toxin-like protein